MQKKAVFFDRDGVLNKAFVINGKPCPPASVNELEIQPEVLPALQKLKKAGFLLIGATNQPDVARGNTSRQTVEEINLKLLSILPLNEIRVCYHDDQDACSCRKPLPGLLLEAATSLNVNLNTSFMIGDRWKDIEAGHRANCKTIFLDYAYQEAFLAKQPHFVASNLIEAAEWIINY